MSFDPVTMLVAGFATQAVGSLIQGEGQAQASEYNATIARQNAEIARQQGAFAMEAQEREAKRAMGRSIAAYGASGVQVDSGSPLDVLADSARMAMLDRLMIQYNAEVKARGYENQSQLETTSAEYSRTSALFGAAGAGFKAAGVYSQNAPSSGGTRIPTYVSMND